VNGYYFWLLTELYHASFEKLFCLEVEKEMKKAYFSKRLYKADMGIPTVN
jgi:hypothetical protein